VLRTQHFLLRLPRVTTETTCEVNPKAYQVYARSKIVASALETPRDSVAGPGLPRLGIKKILFIEWAFNIDVDIPPLVPDKFSPLGPSIQVGIQLALG
jgi:hypothetical protein